MRALQRQWMLLARLPRLPRKIDAATLETNLHEAGIRIHRRTIQRDLVALSRLFPIVCDERNKPFGWSLSQDAPRDGLAMSPVISCAHVALLVKLAASVLSDVLPEDTVRFARMYQDASDSMLSEAPADVASWHGRVRKTTNGDATVSLRVGALKSTPPRK